mmetsp:Transcript_44333/g.43024  ORF Transcript_44333/g.43024 Transcript_44333/m.43024 type:complete len:117 (-) Transcript_44333:28-378(-)
MILIAFVLLGEEHLDVCIVRVEVVVQDLDVILVGDEESLLHRELGQSGVSVHFVLFQDEVVKVLLDKDPINSHIVGGIYLHLLLAPRGLRWLHFSKRTLNLVQKLMLLMLLLQVDS